MVNLLSLAIMTAIPSASVALADSSVLVHIAEPEISHAASQSTTSFISSGGTKSNIFAHDLSVLSRTHDGPIYNYTYSDIDMVSCTFLFRAFKFDQSLSNATIKRVRSLNAGPGFLTLRGNSSNIIIEDVLVKSVRPMTQPRKIPEGIALAGKSENDTGANITIRRVSIDGIRSVGATFLNGDGISVERGYRNVSISDSYAGHNSDAGFDIKSPSARLDHTVSEGNRRNYKFWANQTHGTLTSIDPNGPGSGSSAHVQLLGSSTEIRTIRIALLVARAHDQTPILLVEKGPWDVTIDRCELAVPRGTPLVVGPATLHLGPGCRV